MAYNLVLIASMIIVLQVRSTLIVPKCCSIGEALDSHGKCITSDLPFEPPFWSEAREEPIEEIGVIIGNPCKFGRYRLDPNENDIDEFYILPNGSLYLPFQQVSILPPSSYCTETFLDLNDTNIITLPLVCFKPDKHGGDDQITISTFPTGLMLAVPFLVAAIRVIYTTPVRTDVHLASVILHYTSTLTLLFLLSAVCDLHPSVINTICCLFCSSSQVLFTSVLLWVCVMSITVHRYDRNQCERYFTASKYYTFVWILSVISLLPTYALGLQFVPVMYHKWGNWIKEYVFDHYGTSFMIYYNTLMLISCFVHLFILILNLKKLRILQKDSENDFSGCLSTFKVRLFAYAVFSLALHIHWLLEVISWFIDTGPSWCWVITDVCNLLHGVISYCVAKYVTSKLIYKTSCDCLCQVSTGNVEDHISVQM